MGTRLGETVIGRAHPAGLLRAEIDRVIDSHGGLVLVTGEAGIGKTTLVTGAADDARARGVTVVGGRCWDSESAPGHWPWVQALRGLRRQVSAEQWAAIEEAGGSGLAVLLGKPTDADEFTLYDGVTAALVAASQLAPVMVVFDDLHWADPASLRMLEFASQHTWFERLLLVGTYRDVEVESTGHPLRSLLLPLQSKATTVTLTGLEPADVGALIARTAGREADPDVVAEVHRRTGGNPFFVEQTARLWRADGSLSVIAPGVRDAVRRRLELLPGALVELLTAASVLGHEFHRQLLAAAVAAPVPQVDRLLDQAIAARLVVGRGGGRFAFGHDLVRETLYDALPDDERHERHATVVRAVGDSPALRSRLFPADLARHAYAAGAAIEPAIAVDHLVAAARDAAARLAPEEASGHFRRALERSDDPGRQVMIHLDLGLELAHGGARDDAWAQIESAVATARDLDDPAVLARVALVADRLRGPRSSRSGAIETLLREAHARFVGASGEDLSRERLVGNLIARTEMLARADHNDEALAFSLWSRHDSIWALGSARERAELMAEMQTVAQRSGDRQTAAFAASLRWVALLEMGDPGYYEQLQSLHALTEQFDVALGRMMSSIDGSIIATLRGEFTQAEALQGELAGFFDPQQDEHSYMTHHIRWALLMLRGRLADAAAVVDLTVTVQPPYHTLVSALTATAQGDPGPGLRHVSEVDLSDRDYQRWMHPLFLRLLVELAVLTRDPELAARARAELAPHAGEWLVSLYGCDVSGPVELWVARLDAAEERWAEAVAGFATAEAAANRLGARPWSVIARLGLASALQARGEPVADLLSEVERDATALDMPHLADEARTLATRPTPTATPVTSPAPPAVGSGGPAIAQGGRPAVASGAGPAIAQGSTPAVASGAGPAVRSGSGPAIAQGSTPAVASGAGPAVRSGSGPAIAQGGRPAVASGSGPAIAQGSTPAVASGAGPAVTSGSEPAIAQGSTPAVASGAGPAVRSGSGPAIAQGGRPAVASGSGPAIAQGGRPAVASGPGPAIARVGVAPDSGGGPAVGGGLAGGVSTSDAEFRPEGDVWRLGFGGQVVHLPDAKGLRDLHELLCHPGEDIAAAVLIDPAAGPELVAARRMGGDPVLDDEAKTRYKRRLGQLDEAIDVAAQRGDDRRLAALDAERRALIDELRAAAGLGGRTRRLGDEAERARKTVTARIRDTLRKIDERHPDLANHLRAAVSTGATCRYAPDTPVIWHL